jgi:hypothetical protein
MDTQKNPNRAWDAVSENPEVPGVSQCSEWMSEDESSWNLGVWFEFRSETRTLVETHGSRILEAKIPACLCSDLKRWVPDTVSDQRL